MSHLLPLAAAALLILVHAATPALRFLHGTPRSRWLSFAGGVSVAYVFLHLLPEMAHGHDLLTEDGAGVAFGIWGVGLAALVGFYGIERLVQGDALRRRGSGEDGDERPAVFAVHLASFALYNVVVGYLLVDGEAAHEGWGPSLAFAVAMALHLLVTDFGLTEAFRDGYLRYGRWVLSGALGLGLGLAWTTEVPETWIAVVTAVLGGGVILNVLKEELPAERESRFTALLGGVAVYAAILWALEG